VNRLGIFGGSFDPPHAAHLHIARAARRQFELDRLLWMPASTPPHKRHKLLAPDEDRVRMIELLIEGESGFEINLIELERGGISFTVDTLRYLQDEYPDSHLFLIIGEDGLAGFSSWREPETILELASLLVYRRPGVTVADVPKGTRFINGSMMDISSSELRNRIARGDVPEPNVLPPILQTYIAENGLYRSNTSE